VRTSGNHHLCKINISQINQQVYNNIARSMELLNALTSQYIKKYKVNTQIYNQVKKTNVFEINPPANILITLSN
jgi:hypothetical protein